MSFGLSQKETLIICSILSKHIHSGKVIVYGSRAKGTHTERSDIDLAIKGSVSLDDGLIAKIIDDIEESDFPYISDLEYYEKIKNAALLEHIDRVGKVIYEQSIKK